MPSRVVRDPEILGGKPIIEGTRWPTEIVVAFDFNIVAVREQYPHLRIDQVMAAYLYEKSWHRRFRRYALQRTRRLRWRTAAWLMGRDDVYDW